MARIRTIKPDFWKHEALSELPEATHMLAAALLNYADDEGYFNANPKLVAAECCPLREPSVSVQDSLTALSDIGYLRLGTGADGKRYGQIVHFLDHQKISHPSTSKIKAVSIVWEGSCNPPGTLTEDSALKGREQGIEGEGEDAPALRAAPLHESVEKDEGRTSKRGSRLPDDFEPDIVEAIALGMSRMQAIAEAAKFKDHWRAKPGKDGVKLDWPATWRNWCRRAAEYRVKDGRAAKPPPAVVSQTIWLDEEDAGFKAACANYERETGRKPFVSGSRNRNGVGFEFPPSCIPTEERTV